MKKLNQKGFGLAEGFSILIVSIIVIGTGFFVYAKVKNEETSKPSGDKTQVLKKENKDEKQATAPNQTLGTTIMDVDLKFSSEADITKLPDRTPDSFKTFLLSKLKNDQVDSDGCKPVYTITKISAVNIKGGISRTVASSSGNKDNCITGGAPNLWVLAPNGNWEEVSLNGPFCKSKSGGIVYEEFAPECATSDKSFSYVKNPNGSIANLLL